MNCQNAENTQISPKKNGNHPFAVAIVFLLLTLLTAAISIGFCLLGSYLKERTVPAGGSAARIQKPVIILDAGHGGEDGGAVSLTGSAEKDLNLDMALTLRDLFETAGYSVVLTRGEDILLYDHTKDAHGQKKRQDLATRLCVSQQYPDSLFISLHMNAFSDSRYHGTQVWYSVNDPASQTLAQAIQNGVRSALQPENNRKVKAAGSNIFLLDRIQTPAVLIECGFLSNPEDAALLDTKDYRQKLALTVFSAVSSYCSQEKEN